MLIGAHESTAGGLHAAFARAEADGCEALQIFTGYNTRWAARPLDALEASLYLSEAARLPALPVLSHCSYLLNLASPDAALWERSVDSLVQELERCESLGVVGAVLHPGSHMGAGEAAGLRRVARGLGEVHRRTAGFRTRVLLENTAGQGAGLGHRFGQLGRLLQLTPQGERLGVCIDTCHAFAAGYALDQPAGYAETMQRLEHHVGLGRVQAFHLNGSRKPRGSRVDRHDQVDQGLLGLEAFWLLVNDARFDRVPAVVETPSLADGSSSFSRNIARLKALRLGPAPT